MFEFHAYDARLHGERAAAPTPVYCATRRGDVAALSFLSWSEHCVECAAPDCYASCGLYQPRPDGRCRRFAYGIYRDRRHGGLRGYGADITFRRWGKLKANGNTRMQPAAAVLRRERLLGWAGPLMRLLGRTAGRFGRSNLWADPTRFLDKRARRLHRRKEAEAAAGGPAPASPDAFLLEVINPGREAVGLELEMRVALDLVDPAAAAMVPPPFRTAVRLVPGHNRHGVPHAAFAAVTDCGLPFKMSLTPAGATPRLVFLAADFVAWSQRAGAAAPAVKCVVFDLDDTLWHGVLVEGAAAKLVEGAEETLRELDRRGILLAVASRNDPEPALARLRQFGLEDLFVTTRIGWGVKSRAVAEIAGRLNLGLDAFAFVDDSAFERAEVATALPDVLCLDARLLSSLPDDPRFCGGGSATARNRRRLYREAAQREAARADFTGDDTAFLRSCQTKLEIAPYRAADFERVLELAQRTNQLNASGARYDRAACAALLADPALRLLVLRCADVHGDYGTVGFAAVCPSGAGGSGRIRVEEFMLSCRVQGRRLEQAFFHYLAEAHGGAGAAALWIRFRATPRNGALARGLDELGFGAADGGRLLPLPAASLAADLMRVVELAGAADGGEPAAAPRRAMA